MRKFRFYKTVEGRWFIDLPEWEGEIDDLEMVMGADIMLDMIAQGDLEVELFLSEEEMGDDCYKLELISQDDEYPGAYYNLPFYNSIEFNLPIWLCDVTKYVFGKFPRIIYFR